jgi:hypothetical protein
MAEHCRAPSLQLQVVARRASCVARQHGMTSRGQQRCTNPFSEVVAAGLRKTPGPTDDSHHLLPN